MKEPQVLIRVLARFLFCQALLDAGEFQDALPVARETLWAAAIMSEAHALPSLSKKTPRSPATVPDFPGATLPLTAHTDTASPVVAIREFLVAKLAWYILSSGEGGSRKIAEQLFQDVCSLLHHARKVIAVTHGEGHALYGSLVSLLDEIQATGVHIPARISEGK